MVLDSQLQADPSPTAESRCACRLNGLPKPVVFFRSPARQNIGVAHLTAPLASSEGRAAHDKGNVVLGGSPAWVAIQWLQTLAIGASVLHWLLFFSGRPDHAFACNNIATSHLAAAMASSASH